MDALRARAAEGEVEFTVLVPASPHGLAWAADMHAGGEAARAGWWRPRPLQPSPSDRAAGRPARAGGRSVFGTILLPKAAEGLSASEWGQPRSAERVLRNRSDSTVLRHARAARPAQCYGTGRVCDSGRPRSSHMCPEAGS
jgi:hypothetical protein